MPIPTPETAGRIMQLLDRRDFIDAKRRDSRGGSSGRIPVLVLCDDDTAAAGSGVGAQCYSATVLDINSNDTTIETGASVWLTVVGSTGTPVVPTVDKPYFGLLAGDVEAAGSGTGRLRVFAAEDEGTSLTVKEFDGSPSYSGITSLEFDEADFTVTQPAAGRAKIAAIGGGGTPYTQYPTPYTPSMPSQNTYYDISDTFTLPVGTYHVTADVTGIFSQTGASSSGYFIMDLKLYDVTNSADYDARRLGGGTADVMILSAPFSEVITVTGSSMDFKFQARISSSGTAPTLNFATIQYSNIHIHGVK